MEDKFKFIKIPNANVELHAHPGKLLRKQFMDISREINSSKLDVVALEGKLDESIYPLVCKQVEKYYEDTLKDEAGIRYTYKRFFRGSKERFLLNAREYSTKEGFHILTIGYSIDDAVSNMEIRKIIDSGLENNALIVISHPFVDNGKTKTAGHISDASAEDLGNLCKEYSGEIALEWNGYCNNFARRIMKIAVNTFGKDTKIIYHDVNARVKDFAWDLFRDEKTPEFPRINVPVVSGTDLHARGINTLGALGTSRIKVDVEGKCASEILSSMKENIFKRDFYKTEKTVGAWHLGVAYGVPLLNEIAFKKIQSYFANKNSI